MGNELSTRTDRNTIVQDPALAAMGLLPGSANPAMLSWRTAWILVAVSIVALIGMFWQTAEQIVSIWSESKTYNHGFLIPAIVVYLIWIKRGALANTIPQPDLRGAVAILAAGFGWLLGELGSVSQVQHFALAFMIQGVFFTVFGIAASRVLIFPLGYILFAVPFGEFMVAPLQDITAVFVVKGLQLVNIPVFLDGVFLSIPTGNFEVAEACSGIRFLIATIALGTLFAHLNYVSRLRKYIFIFLTMVVPVVANGFRAFGIVLLAYYTNNKLAVGVDHLVYGWIFFAFVTIIMLIIGMSFRDQEPVDEAADPEIQRTLLPKVVDTRRFIVVAAVMLAVTSIAPGYAMVIAGRSIDAVPGPIPPPKVTGGWKLLPASKPPYVPVYPNSHAKFTGAYEKDGKRVDLFIAFFASQRQGGEVIHFRNKVVDGDVWQRASSNRVLQRIDGPLIEVERHRILKRRAGRVVYQWFWVGNRGTGGRTIAKILQSISLLFGLRESAASIVVSTAYDEVPYEADVVLYDFIENMERTSQFLDRYARGGS